MPIHIYSGIGTPHTLLLLCAHLYTAPSPVRCLLTHLCRRSSAIAGGPSASKGAHNYGTAMCCPRHCGATTVPSCHCVGGGRGCGLVIYPFPHPRLSAPLASKCSLPHPRLPHSPRVSMSVPPESSRSLRSRLSRAPCARDEHRMLGSPPIRSTAAPSSRGAACRCSSLNPAPGTPLSLPLQHSLTPFCLLSVSSAARCFRGPAPDSGMGQPKGSIPHSQQFPLQPPPDTLKLRAHTYTGPH